MGDARGVRKDDPALAFQLASSEEMQAHQLLGRMSASSQLGEFTEAVRELFPALRCIARTVTRLGHPPQHPFDALTEPPRVYEMARPPHPPTPDDFYFELHDHKPALTLCSEYLRYLSALLERSRQTLQRLGYAPLQ